jgi:SSS family solute:Na+ symporter
VISLVAYVLTKIAVGIFAGGIVFRTLVPDMGFTIGTTHIDSFWIGSFVVVALTGAYTVLGGFRAVAYTEAVQTFILILGSVSVTVFGLRALGGWQTLREICGSEMFNLWQPLMPEGVAATWKPIRTPDRAAWYFDNGVYPWVGMMFCAPVIGLWYWCTDQYIVQRVLGAQNETEARRGSIFASFLKLLPVFIFIIPGMICFALAKQGNIPGLQELVDANGEVVRGKAQAAFPLMVTHVLPAGVRGVIVAGLLSALMSSLSGVFNACSTLFTIDLYAKLHPHATQRQLVWTGRVATAVMVLSGLAWIPVIANASGLYAYLQSVQAYLGPPIFVVFFGGIFFKRMNAAGCLAALLVGFALGLWRLAVDTPVSLGWKGYEQGYAEGSLNYIINNMYFQYFSLAIFIICAAVMFIVSYLSPAPSYDRISGLTYGAVTEEHRRESRESWGGVDILTSLTVIVAIVAAYVYFSG